MSPFIKEALEAQAQHWKNEAERQRRARLLEALIGLVALGALLSFTIWYTAWSQTRADARWCALMVPLDQRYQRLESRDLDAQAFALQVHTLTGSLHCQTPPPPQGSPHQESPSGS